MKERKRKGTCLLLGVVEDKFYYRCVGEHKQTHGYLRDSRVDMTRLSHVRREGRGEGERRIRRSSQEAQRE